MSSRAGSAGGDLAALRAVLPVPVGPLVPTKGWAEVEADLGVVLPPAYRGVAETWGRGSIGGELGVSDLRIRSGRAAWIDGCTTAWPEDPLPLPMYPTDGPGLFPLATNGNGDTVYGIVRSGVVDDATLWVGNTRDGDWLAAQGPYDHFLLRVVTGAVPELVELFGEVWELEPTFRPAGPPRHPELL